MLLCSQPKRGGLSTTLLLDNVYRLKVQLQQAEDVRSELRRRLAGLVEVQEELAAERNAAQEAKYRADKLQRYTGCCCCLVRDTLTR